MDNTDILCQELTNKLNDIKNLSVNWNGYGAKPFNKEFIESVELLIKDLPCQPELFPTANKSIQLEYKNSYDDYLEFELFENGEIEEFYYSHDKKEITKYISKDMIFTEINNFYK